MWLGLWYLNPFSPLFQLVLLVEETGVPGENHRPVEVTDNIYHKMLYRVQLYMNRIRTHNYIGDRY